MPVNVLLVDDNPDSIKLVMRQLIRAGDYQVDSIDSGTACLEMLKEKQYDILLLDYKLPGMNGIEVLDSIVKGEYDLPVVMITGQGDEEIAVSALKKGAYEYLVKSGDFLKNIPNLINRVVEKHNTIKKKEELEMRLAKSEEKYRTLFENAKDGIVVIDPGSGSILDLNREFENMTGYARDELLKKGICELRPKETGQAGKNHFWGIVGGKKTEQFLTLSVQRKDGQIIEIEVNSRVLEYDDMRVVQCIVRDITEKKRMEEELKKRLDQLERFQKITMGRELRIIELKKEVERLRKEAGGMDHME